MDLFRYGNKFFKIIEDITEYMLIQKLTYADNIYY